jgi:hypothetical protein
MSFLVIERVGGETTSPFSSKGVKAFDSQSERIHPRLASRESWSAQSDSAAATSSNQDIESKNFRRRLFVQYLWRNVKPNEKSRVQKEVIFL